MPDAEPGAGASKSGPAWLDAGFRWLNEPPSWQAFGDGVSLVTGAQTDFWQDTFYGFRRDNGHALLRPVSGDFSASATIRGDYEHLYDQAGMMLRADAGCWVKTGIEFTDGLMHFSTVVTLAGRSDWSVIPLPDAETDAGLHVRLTRHGDAIRVQYALGSSSWRMARLAPFPQVEAAVGLMACSPQRAGFRARFADFEVGPPISRQLHDH